MKKSIMLALVALFIGLLAGCASVPNNCNLTGTWKYTFEESGKDETQTGLMTLTQDQYTLKGKANDAFGEFNLTGSNIAGTPNISIEGVRIDNKRTFNFSGKLTTENEFEGTYTTNQNTSGTLEANRVIPQ